MRKKQTTNVWLKCLDWSAISVVVIFAIFVVLLIMADLVLIINKILSYS